MEVIHYIEDSQPPATATACGLPVRAGQIWVGGRALGGTIIRESTTCDACRFRMGLGQAPPELMANPHLPIPEVLHSPVTPEEIEKHVPPSLREADRGAPMPVQGENTPAALELRRTLLGGAAAPIAEALPASVDTVLAAVDTAARVIEAMQLTPRQLQVLAHRLLEQAILAG